MKVSYIFPLLKSVNAESFFTDFCKTEFYKKYSDYEMFFIVSSADKANLDYLNALALKREEIKLITIEGKFSYGRAFEASVAYVKGDVTLLGDTGIYNNHEIFEELMNEHADGAQVVQIKKDHGSFVNGIKSICGSIYNFFVKVFSGNTDILNVPSLGLLDKTVTDIMSTLPYKANFLRNCMYMEGIDMRTHYIDPKANTQKNNYCVYTLSFMFLLALSGLFVATVVMMTVFNTIEMDVNIIALNIILVFVLLLSIASILIAVSKHVLDVRMSRIRIEGKILAMQNITIEKDDELPAQDIKFATEESKASAKKTVKKSTRPTEKRGNR